MAIADLNPRDYLRLFNAFKEARSRDTDIVPTLEELVPEIKLAVDKDGELVDNLARVFGEPIRRGFELVKSVINEKHGAAYTADIWARLLKKSD